MGPVRPLPLWLGICSIVVISHLIPFCTLCIREQHFDFRSISIKTPLSTIFRTDLLCPEVLHHIYAMGPVRSLPLWLGICSIVVIFTFDTIMYAIHWLAAPETAHFLTRTSSLSLARSDHFSITTTYSFSEATETFLPMELMIVELRTVFGWLNVPAWRHSKQVRLVALEAG